MNKATNITAIKTHLIFKLLLFLYPLPYRKRFGKEMELLINDISEEELAIHGKIRFVFWISLIFDLFINSIKQHQEYERKYGLRKYMNVILHINKYNIWGMMLLLPFISMLSVDAIFRIIQGDLRHASTVVSHSMYNSPFYWFPILFTWVILFPTLAVFINGIPIVRSLLRKKRHAIFPNNIVSFILFILGISILGLLVLHDVLPCVVKHFFVQKMFNPEQLYAVCKDA